MTTTLAVGDTVVIELDGKAPLGGRFVSSDAGRIVIWSGGSEQLVPRQEIVRVIRLSHPYHRGALVGALLGSAITGALIASDADFNAAGRILWVSAGAASGAAVGSRADRYRKREIVFAR